ncbi:MAG: Hsp20/alpha crystallin family protein [Alphaproteobacteria bacterium]|nr:Hsp20/alpha crystallin family protein [Alphaproteobacteria bacterium]
MAGLLPTLWGEASNQNASLTSLHREIDKVFDEFHRNFGISRPWNGQMVAGSMLAPNIDVVESENALEVTAELPGVSKDDVEVTVAEGVLTIRGEKKAEKKEEKDNYRMVERSYGSFQRSLRLPFNIEADQIDAQFTEGVLKIVLPKPAEAEAKVRKVDIKQKS